MTPAVRLLLLTPQLPYPPHQGTSLRNFNLIAQLARRHRVCLLTFLEPDQSMEAAGPLLDLCEWVDTIPVPRRSQAQRLRQMLTTRRPDMAWRLWSPAFRDRLAARLAEAPFDVVQIEAIELAPYLPAIEASRPRPLVVYEDHNAEWVLQKRACLTDLRVPRRWPAAAYSFVQWMRLKTYEAGVCRRADRVVAVSEADRDAIRTIAPGIPVTVVPNGVDLDEHAGYRGPREPYDLVFTGKMDFRPNVDAMLWFGEEVWPRLRAERPDARLAIVGQRPHARLEGLRAAPGVTLTGWVEDVRPYIAGATVYIAPLRVGGGTRLKLLQAMAMGAAVVATSLGAEGFPVTHGQELLLADTPDDFARAVLRLLDSPEERARLGAAARRFVEATYGWDALIPKLEALYLSAPSDNAAGDAPRGEMAQDSHNYVLRRR
jgi:sugar transferase (PEP-CTERM/EpsH1 system associated)